MNADGNQVIGAIQASYTMKPIGKSTSGIAMNLFDFKEGKIVCFREVAVTSAEAFQ
ncbi:MAG: hypothetical protein KJT03_08445 [Verrucomicrobiae bacterium]|nr:hypothetical protein [Verrucomicrobiae bacterium]